MSILDKAKEIIYGDREQTYGDPGKNLRLIGDLWKTYLGLDSNITAEDVSNMMILLKVARLKNTPGHEDSLTDVAGYAALIERVRAPKPAPTTTDAPVDATGKTLYGRVRVVSPSAARWVQENCPKIAKQRNLALNAAFSWAHTPQGWICWNDINTELLEQGYERRTLHERVSDIDPGAAEWLLVNYPSCVTSYDKGIGGLFDWSDTQQGPGYWRNIDQKLRGYVDGRG